MEKPKSPLQLVADEIEREQIKKMISDRYKHVKKSVYERIKQEMRTEKFNEVLSLVLEKHGVNDTLQILSLSIEKVAMDSVLAIVKKNKKA